MPLITGSLVAAPDAHTRPVLCYHSIFDEEAGTWVTTGTNRENAFNWLTWNSWTTTATGAVATWTATNSYTADYFAIAGHDLHNNFGTITLEYYNGAAWVEVAAFAPGDQYPMIMFFDAVTSNQWRITITSLAAVDIAVIAAGERLVLERGYHGGSSPPPYSHNNKILNMKAQGGQLLGRAVQRHGIVGNIKLEWLTAGHVRDEVSAFLTHADTKGFFIVEQQEVYLNEVGYVWSTKNIVATWQHPRFMSMPIPYEGIAR